MFPALIWALVILFLSAHPQMGLSRHWGWIQPDKIGHAGAYALLAFLLQLGFKRWFFPVIIGTLYGIAIEFMQHAFFYGRQFDLLDMLANFIGCLMGVVVFHRFGHLFPFFSK